MRSPKKLSRPFIVSLDLGLLGGAALAGAVACGGESSSSQQTTECPKTQPSGGCNAAPDLWCTYGGGPCGTSYQCVGGKWTIIPSSCNPPPPSCPAETTPLPKEGATCPSGWGVTTCTFQTSCGLPGTATCSGSTYYDVVDPCSDAGVDAAADVAAESSGDATPSADAADSGG